jgi:hypothetical protein
MVPHGVARTLDPGDQDETCDPLALHSRHCDPVSILLDMSNGTEPGPRIGIQS